VVIDTAHNHPVESLNFLCTLPYLNDGAIAVFHDISLFYHENANRNALAMRILISALASEKIFPEKKQQYISKTEQVYNICAVVITSQLRQNIDNIFLALSLPWETYPVMDIMNVRKLLAQHYNAEQLTMFDEADRSNLAWRISGGSTYSIDRLALGLRKLTGEVVFYGAGENMRYLLQLYHYCGIDFDYRIWDINAKSIDQIDGHHVSLPDFETEVSSVTAVITIFNQFVAFSVKNRLERIGYDCICGMNEIFSIDDNSHNKPFPLEFTAEEKELLFNVERGALTMVSRERMYATMISCKYVVENSIPGDFVECGVWRGGNAILAAGIFKLYGSDKRVWLFDTFEGFNDAGIKPDERDEITTERMDEVQKLYYNPESCGNSIDDVRANFDKFGLLSDNIRFIKGDVLETLISPDTPHEISVLRLDTDLYESTLTELDIFYPRVAVGGILMIDDYGDCVGARKAVETYFSDKTRPPLQYIDYTGRIGVKVED